MSMVSKAYFRDKRSPTPKSDVVSRVMSANKAKDTAPEIALRKAFWSQGARGYRLHKRVEGTRPDIVFTKQKIAIFVHGCYWHRCPDCKLPLPKNNISFWKQKFERNKQRDKEKTHKLKKAGWKVLVVWECQVTKDSTKLPDQILTGGKILLNTKSVNML